MKAISCKATKFFFRIFALFDTFLYLCICFDIIHIKLHIIIYKIRLAQAGVYELEAEENFRKNETYRYERF